MNRRTHRRGQEPRNRYSGNQRSRYTREYREYDDRDENNLNTGRDYRGHRAYDDEVEGAYGRGEYQGDQYDEHPSQHSDREGRRGYGSTFYDDGGDTYEYYDDREDYDENHENDWDDVYDENLRNYTQPQGGGMYGVTGKQGVYKNEEREYGNRYKNNQVHYSDSPYRENLYRNVGQNKKKKRNNDLSHSAGWF